jgi:signal transduction histidine kinase
MGAHAGTRGLRLRIVVDDDGLGIDAAQRDAVMARGARIDESVPGSGLGLSIVQELVQLYGGTVVLQAGPLGGLRVVLDLPGAGGVSRRVVEPIQGAPDDRCGYRLFLSCFNFENKF